MGAVYKALDRELNRQVAIKTIRPELAAQRQVLDRFKQEVVLTSQIAHPNVVRVYDLGTAGSLRFLSMEFVEGRMLTDIMRERRLPPEESASLIREVCLGLAAAHAKNVIHRDRSRRTLWWTAAGAWPSWTSASRTRWRIPE